MCLSLNCYIFLPFYKILGKFTSCGFPLRDRISPLQRHILFISYRYAAVHKTQTSHWDKLLAELCYSQYRVFSLSGTGLHYSLAKYWFLHVKHLIFETGSVSSFLILLFAIVLSNDLQRYLDLVFLYWLMTDKYYFEAGHLLCVFNYKYIFFQNESVTH
jgi:hypothetical protein